MHIPAVWAAFFCSRLLGQATQAPARTGAWSVYSVLFIVLNVLLGLVMLVALIVLAMTGRFRPEQPDVDSFQAQLGAAPTAGMGTAPEGGETHNDSENTGTPDAAPHRLPSFIKKLFHSGLAQALLSVLLTVPAIAAFYGLENIYGRLSGFTPGAALLLALLAAQVFCICWLVRRLRKNR